MDDPLPIPGTVQQVDLDHSLYLNNKEQEDIVLIPRPSSHLDDPLNWSRYRKILNSTCQMAWCFFAAALISGLSSSYLLISEDTGISVADLSTGNGLMYLFMGWGTLLTQNLAQDFGRRPVLLVGMLVSSLLQVWSAYMKSEALIELCIADIHFAHDRGFHMGVYNWTLWCGAFLSPIAGGFVAEAMGWRWIQYILAIICLCFTVATFFGFEETMFFRQVNIQEPMFSTPKDTVALEASHCTDGEMVSESKEPESPGVTPVVAEETYKIKTYAQKLKLWGLRHPSQPFNFFRSIFLSFRLLCFPTVIFSGLLVGSILAWRLLSGSAGRFPYNFTTQEIGLTYFASVIGVSIGCYFSGWLSDILAIKLARRRQGIKEPEDRLWMFLIPLVAHPLGCVLYGVGASHHIPWIGVVIGIALICITLPMGSGLAITYIIDSQKELAGESIVTVILIRNTIGFAFAYAVNPMIVSMGLQNTFILIAVLGVIVWSACLLWIKIGKAARRSIAKSYWNLLRINSHPDETIFIQSRNREHSITVHIYRPPVTEALQTPSPVLLNFHGSGFVVPAHGSDDEFCRQMSQKTGYIVLDVEYRLAPENPFPAALNDTEDAINWVLGQPTKFDISKVAISGFSAGGNLALALSSCIFPPETFSSVVAFYPTVEVFVDPSAVAAPDPNGQPFPTFVLRLFARCYMLDGHDPKDPRISPAYADFDRFPRRVLIVTAAYDSLAVEAENLAARLRENSGRIVISERMERCNHGWDKMAKEGTFEWEAKERAYKLAVDMLKCA
ncbi:hypothetical protein N7519_008732 [Penicillium mononematosum]|uniref:uncharacterized protein n=1 Tax=Penicillium mononematosum TaxID=268346 RepID=UPI002549456D|nr:uncharacterized protein N7519_008732 [Penicillium mononematosum]KAJ6178271.1 hypothetical protein N7519_008732 [Penicillium mononematosum]